MIEQIATGLLVTVIGGILLYLFGINKPTNKSTKVLGSQNSNVNNNRGTVIINNSSSSNKPAKDEPNSSFESEIGEKDTAKNSPLVIIEEINSYKKPYMRKQAEESFLGLKVSWRLEFQRIDFFGADNNIAHLSFSKGKGFRVWIHCEVSLEDYPELKTLEEGKIIVITGKIYSVSAGTIYLKDVKLNF